jgi:hypothetical protein
MPQQKITISEALGVMKTLKARAAELIALRNGNARAVERYFGNEAAPREVQKPEYDAKALDKQITLIARELRLCESATKRMNVKVVLEDYTWDDSVLGELK